MGFLQRPSLFVCVCLENPCRLANSIKLACNTNCIQLVNGIRVDKLEPVGTGAHGLKGIVSDVVIYSCEIHEMGGSYLKRHYVINCRYGNGSELWLNTANMAVVSYMIYGVAVTMQGDKVTTIGLAVGQLDAIVAECLKTYKKAGMLFLRCQSCKINKQHLRWKNHRRCCYVKEK